MGTQAIRAAQGTVRVDVLVVPNASRSHVVGRHGDRVKVRISAPPERGRANKALVALLVTATEATGATVVSGETSRRKTVELTGVDVATVRARLIGDTGASTDS
jgi:uncharacterized protein (TIGR00251 family)